MFMAIAAAYTRSGKPRKVIPDGMIRRLAAITDAIPTPISTVIVVVAAAAVAHGPLRQFTPTGIHCGAYKIERREEKRGCRQPLLPRSSATELDEGVVSEMKVKVMLRSV